MNVVSAPFLTNAFRWGGGRMHFTGLQLLNAMYGTYRRKTMTRARAKELAPIIQAYAEGEKIEYRAPYARTWTAIENPEWTDCQRLS